MNTQLKLLTLTMVLSAGVLCSPAVQAADEAAPSAAQRAHDEAQQLLKARDDARVKAKAAEKKLREAGVQIDSLGFDSARAARDRQASTGSKLAAYDRYAKTARRLERKAQTEVEQGKRAVAFSEIARFERLQAEVELAEVEGRLPVTRETEK